MNTDYMTRQKVTCTIVSAEMRLTPHSQRLYLFLDLHTNVPVSLGGYPHRLYVNMSIHHPYIDALLFDLRATLKTRFPKDFLGQSFVADVDYQEYFDGILHPKLGRVYFDAQVPAL